MYKITNKFDRDRQFRGRDGRIQIVPAKSYIISDSLPQDSGWIIEVVEGRQKQVINVGEILPETEKKRGRRKKI